MPDHLKYHALWIIMDPWEKHPSIDDVLLCPDLNDENLAMAEKICAYVQSFPHVKVSCDKNCAVTSCLSHLHNICYDVSAVVNYMTDNSLQDIVYAGFHHGRCTVGRPTGARSRHLQKYRRWVVRDLVGVLCFDDPEIQDQITREHAMLIYTQ